MKKYFPFLFLIVLFYSCNDDESIKPDNPAQQLVGDYKLISLEANMPLDLNFDGVLQQDLWEEVDCIYHDSLEFQRLLIRVYGPLTLLDYKVIHSYQYSDIEPYWQCFSTESMGYENFIFNTTTGTLEITDRDEEREAQYGKLITVDYDKEQEEITAIVEKELFTSEGWQVIQLTSVYKKIIY